MKVKEGTDVELTVAEMDVINRLRSSYPRVIYPEDILHRSYYTAWGRPGEVLKRSAGAVHSVRRKLGQDAIESVYEYRIGVLGQPARGPLVGYRLGPTMRESKK